MTTIRILILIGCIALTAIAQFALAPMVSVLRKKKQVRVLGGAGLYVVWDPNEVLIIRRNGELKASKPGGAQFIYPLLGEEVRARISLGVQSLTWKDRVQMQEAIPCDVELTVRWAVKDVSKYFFRNSLEDHPNRSEEAAARIEAEKDLRDIIGEQVSKIVSEASFPVSLIETLILKQSEYRNVNNNSVDVENISANLGRDLQATLNPATLNKKFQDSGLAIERVEIQSIEWAAEIQAKILGTWLNRLKVEKAKSKAEISKITGEAEIDTNEKKLEGIARILGLDAARVLEVLKHLPSGFNINQDELLKAIVSAVTTPNLNSKVQAKVIATESQKGELNEGDFKRPE